MSSSTNRKKKPVVKPLRVIVREDQSGWAPPSPGHPAYRAWLYSGDEYGREFKGGEGAMVVRETRSYAPAPTVIGDDDAAIRISFDSRVANLTDDEREVLRLQGKLTQRIERRQVIAAGELVDYQRDGYTLVPGSAHTVERTSLPSLECVEVVGYEIVQVEQLSYVAIGERMDIDPERVHSLVKSAMRKMRG